MNKEKTIFQKQGSTSKSLHSNSSKRDTLEKLEKDKLRKKALQRKMTNLEKEQALARDRERKKAAPCTMVFVGPALVRR